jgi:hypothetical protein
MLPPGGQSVAVVLQRFGVVLLHLLGALMALFPHVAATLRWSAGPSLQGAN